MRRPTTLFEIKVEKGIPIPDKRTDLAAALRSMNVGDSFAYPAKFRHNIGNRALRLKPKRFASRKIGPVSIRVWRVK